MRMGIAVLAAVLLLVPAAPAHARVKDPDKRPCFSQKELERVREGWTRDRVEAWTETTDLGSKMLMPGPMIYGYFYPGCKPGHRVAVYYRYVDDSMIRAHD